MVYLGPGLDGGKKYSFDKDISFLVKICLRWGLEVLLPPGPFQLPGLILRVLGALVVVIVLSLYLVLLIPDVVVEGLLVLDL